MRRENQAAERFHLPCLVGVLTLAVLLLPLADRWASAQGIHAHPAAIHHAAAHAMHAAGFGYRGHGTVRHAAHAHYRAQAAGQLQQNRIDAAERMQDERWDNIDHAARDYCGPYYHGDDDCWDRYNDQWDDYYREHAARGPTTPAAAADAGASANDSEGSVPLDGGASFVTPPVGTTVKKIPVDYQFVTVGDKTYDYYQGTFYSYASEGPKKGFTAVTPPVGAVVPSAPTGATTQTVKGQTYLVVDGTYYRKVHSGSQVAYQVVADPGGS